MAINKKLIHFKKYSDFNSKKLSANEANTQYTVGVGGTITNGNPEVLFQSICWIKDVQKMWTHGTIYDCTPSGTVEHANTANDLTGRMEATPEVFTYRASAGNTSIKDSSAVIKRIKGNSVIWNQLIYDGNFKNTLFWKVNDGTGTTLSIANNKATVTSKYSGTGLDVVAIKQSTSPSIKNHKYYVTLDFSSSNSGLSAHFEWYKAFSGYTSNMTKSGNTYRGIFTASADGATGFYLKPQGTKAVGNTWTWSNVMMVDLTKMFGAGNEPTTVQDFAELYPNSYYDTNSQGELISVATEAIKTIGFNQWDGSYINGYVEPSTGALVDDSDYQRTNYIKVLPNTDYYINSEASGSEWGAWYDSNYQYIEGIDGFNQVIKSPATAKYVVLVVSSMASGGNLSTFCLNLSHTGYRNGEYEPYKEVMHDLAISKATGGEPLRKVGNVYDEINETHYIKRIGTRDYQDEDTGDTEILTDGVTTLYVLDNEVTTALNEPIDFSYYVEDFGTEEAISSVVSAPFSADIVYQFNAVDRIRQNDTNISILNKKLAELSVGGESSGGSSSDEIYVWDIDFETNNEGTITDEVWNSIYNADIIFIPTVSGVFRKEYVSSNEIEISTIHMWRAKISRYVKISIHKDTKEWRLNYVQTEHLVTEISLQERWTYSTVYYPVSDSIYEYLVPNLFYIFDEVGELDIIMDEIPSENFPYGDMDRTYEFVFQFTSGATPTALTLPDFIKWANNTPPTISANKIYQISILNNLAVYLEFDNEIEILENFINIGNGGILNFTYPTNSELTVSVQGRTTGMPSMHTFTIPVGTSSFSTGLSTVLYINSVTPASDSKYNYTYHIS